MALQTIVLGLHPYRDASMPQKLHAAALQVISLSKWRLKNEPQLSFLVRFIAVPSLSGQCELHARPRARCHAGPGPHGTAGYGLHSQPP